MLSALQVAVSGTSTTVQTAEEHRMKKMKSSYWKAIYILLSLAALILAVGAPETLGW